MELFTQKVVTKLSKIPYEFGIRDPRSGIRNKPIPDPGCRGQKGTNPGSGSATLLKKYNHRTVRHLRRYR
jgi:hypothetical protein